MRGLLFYGAALLATAVWAEEGVAPLPEPLTLEAALERAETHPALIQAQAGVAVAEARRAGAMAATAWTADLEARVRAIEPSPVATDQDHEDHQLGLRLGKTLYDFGRSTQAVEAAQARQRGATYAWVEARNIQRLEVLECFFAVLSADLAYASVNEAMAVAYVELDRLRNRRELGQVNPVELLAKDAAYQTLRVERVRAQHEQQATRVRLLAALGASGSLPATLIPPSLVDLRRPMPDLAGWLAQAAQTSPQLQALQAQLDASSAAKAAARAEAQPTLRAELEAYTYTRALSGRDELRAGLVLQVPLATGGRVQALVAEREAERQVAQARWQQRQLEVRQVLSEIWLALQGLRAEHEALRAGMDYRESYLDRSRALYELEVQADLGDAMVQISAQRLRLAQNEYAQLLAWAKADAVLGKTVWDSARLTEGVGQ